MIFTLILICQILSVSGEYIYAPVPKPLAGNLTLDCVGISYNTPVNDAVTADRCAKGAEGVNNFYVRNSRGIFGFKTSGHHMIYNGPSADYQKAELIAKQTFKAQKYIIPSVFRKSGNHANNDIAHVIQFTGWVWNHEVGHLLGLQHTGVFTVAPNGKVTYNQYGDQDSVMGGGGIGSKYLSAPQYYQKGWLPKQEAAMYRPGTVYELKQVTNPDGLKGLTIVVIPFALLNKAVPNAGYVAKRPAYVAFPKTCPSAKCFALYLADKGGSSIIAKSDSELYDNHFTGLHIKIVGMSKDTVNVTIDFVPTPRGRLQLPAEASIDVSNEIADLSEDNDDANEDNAITRDEL